MLTYKLRVISTSMKEQYFLYSVIFVDQVWGSYHNPVSAFVHTKMYYVRLLCDDDFLPPNAQLNHAVWFVIFLGVHQITSTLEFSNSWMMV